MRPSKYPPLTKRLCHAAGVFRGAVGYLTVIATLGASVLLMQLAVEIQLLAKVSP